MSPGEPAALAQAGGPVEVFLRVHDGTSGQGPTDVVARVEPSHTVAELAAALASHLDGWSSPAALAPAGLARDATGGRLDPSLTLAEVGLLSGDDLRLTVGAGRNDPTRPAGAGATPPASGTGSGRELLVCSGPDVGRAVGLDLDSGSLLVGRDRSCGLVLSDPRLARVELALEVDDRGQLVLAPDREARSRVRLNGVAVDGELEIEVGDLIALGATTLTVRQRQVERPPAMPVVPPAAEDGARAEVGQLAFHRTPYYPAPVEARVFDALGDLPEAPEPVRFAYLAAAAPLLMGLTMAVVYSPRFLVFTLFSPVIAIGAYLEQRRRDRQRYDRGESRFRQRLDARRVEVEAALAEERRRRFLAAPDLATLAARARCRSVELWVRDRRAADFLTLRVGLGDAVPLVGFRPETRGDERLRDELEVELAPASVLSDVPVTVALADLVVVGVVGAASDTTALASSLVLQASCLHSPEDLVVVAGVAQERAMTGWLKWLPHARSASSPIGSDHLATTTDGVDRLLKELLVVAEARLAGSDRAIDRRWPWLLAVIDRGLRPEPSTVSRLLDAAPGAGISVVWLAARHDHVPRQAQAVVSAASLVSPDRSRLSHTAPAVADQELEAERVSEATAEAVSRALAPLRDASSATASSGLPRLVTLFQALGVDDPSPDWIAARWSTSRGHSLLAPIGMAAGGPLVIDLVAHGPHGLIGGTSGAGKSELIMSMVAGLIACNSPRSLNLLFIDYKGGAASDVFKDVPHTVGYVTNLDAALARRALTSLRAELNRRMDLLQGRAKDVAEMIRRHGDEAPPSLVIIVDEFATLVKEIPEFVAGIVDIAQRGRSLGIHLMLATQRPSGAVNENILANTNLRICLRMLDSAESTSIIGTSDAATIPLPLKGRGFVRLGPGELVAVQSAWSGAPAVAERGRPPVAVEPFDTGPRRARADAATGTEPGEGTTQIEQLVAAVGIVTDRLGIGPGRAPWRDELPTHLPLDTVRREAAARWGATGAAGPGPGTATETMAGAGSGWRVAIGMLDDPEGQDQYPLVVDLEAGGGLLVFGTGGSGKTTALLTLAAAAALDHVEPGGRPLAILGLDFASRELTALGSLPPCVAVAAGDELEGVTRIIALLDAELRHRRAAVAAATRDGGPPPDHQRVLLVIDDYGNLAQAFEGAGAGPALYQWLEAVNRIIVDGRQVGIHTALSATRRSAVKAVVLSAVANRLVLRQADPGSYAELGLGAAVSGGAELPPGRGFCNGPNAVQLASLAEPVSVGPRSPTPRSRSPVMLGAAAGAEAAGLRKLAATLGAGPGSPGRDPVPGQGLVTSPLPDDLDLLDGAGSGHGPMVVPLGLSDLELAVVELDLSVANLTVVGDPRSGRSTALATIGHHLAAAGCEVWVVGPPGSRLAQLDKAARSATGRAAELAPVLDEMAADAASRGGGAELVLLVDDVDLLEDPVLDPPAARLLSAGVRYAASTASLRGYSTNAIVQDMKKARALLYLRPPSGRDVQELAGCNPLIRPGLAMVAGRGVLVVDRVATVLQVADYFARR